MILQVRVQSARVDVGRQQGPVVERQVALKEFQLASLQTASPKRTALTIP